MSRLRVSIIVLCLSLASHADTYNFYFKQKKQKPDVEEDQQEEEATVKAPPAPATPAPIVINNTNNNQVGGTGQSITSGSATPASAPSPVAPETSNATSATVASKPADGRYFKLSAGPVFFVEPFASGITDERYGKWGGLVSLGYHFTETTAMNGYAGARGDSLKLHAGLDFEFLPFRFGVVESWNLFELGVLAGASTAYAASGNIGTFHGGVRANINLGPELGVTAATRANLGYVMFEAGITARL